MTVLSQNNSVSIFAEGKRFLPCYLRLVLEYQYDCNVIESLLRLPPQCSAASEVDGQSAPLYLVPHRARSDSGAVLGLMGHQRSSVASVLSAVHGDEGHSVHSRATVTFAVASLA